MTNTAKLRAYRIRGKERFDRGHDPAINPRTSSSPAVKQTRNSSKYQTERDEAPTAKKALGLVGHLADDGWVNLICVNRS